MFVPHIPQSCSGSLTDHVPRYPMVGQERMRRLHIGVYLGFGMEYAMACAALSLGGVLDQFTNLRFCFFEAGAGWLPNAMVGCDRAFYIRPQCSLTKTRPSELIKKHCFTAVESTEHIPVLAQSIGTDYPHGEYKFLPNTVESITGLEGISDRDRENILGRTMLRVPNRE